jgi:D-alanine-D-alanine ligase
MPEPRVLILFNQPVLPPDHPDRGSEDDVLYSVKVVGDSLKAGGFPADSFGVTDDLAAVVARLTVRDFDVVFNLYEGTADRSVTEVYLTGLLEWMNVSYTGCPSFTLSVARNKPVAKRLFQAAGVRTAEFAEVSTPDVPGWEAFPAIVKPAAEDASVGIDQGAVVSNAAELHARVKYVIDHYGPPVLVERYVAGREIQVSLIDLNGDGRPAVLPFSEIAFKPAAGGLWPIYTYTAKWHEESEEYKQAPVLVGVTLADDVTAALTDVAARTFHLLGARDYARVDTRVSPAGEVFVLEMNPNPAVTSVMIDEGLPAVGSTYDKFIAALVRNAWGRAVEVRGSRRVRAGSGEPGPQGPRVE